ncbi:MAG: phosphate signaling complex protein PhoU [Xanthomonadales bacterium]|nr:phosphate signaling complex protein PhoU [Xanthomonadales bacterium]
MEKLQHISRQYGRQLEAVRRKVLKMGGLVESQLAGAVECMVTGDAERARHIANQDYQINALEVEIDEDCTRILATRQPAASDLRLVMAVIKTITDLERIGDEAERIARMAKFMGGDVFRETTMSEFDHMGQLVRQMLGEVLDAFARTDVDQAVKVVKADEKVDLKYESLIRQLMTYMVEDPRCIPVILNIQWAARSLERIGDRSQNIAEYIIYLVQGKNVRHTSLESVLAGQPGDSNWP